MNLNSRRGFLSKGAIMAGGLLVGNKSNSRKTSTKSSFRDGYIIGHGDFKYKVHKNWGNLNADKYPVHHCHEMVQDKKGRLIMCNTDTRNNIMIYDRSGKLLETWGNEFPGAHGLTLVDEGGEEFLYLTDTVLHKVFKLNLKGKKILTIDYPDIPELYTKSIEFTPTETVVTSDGDILIADGYGKDYVLRYDQSGNFMNYFAGKGDHEKHVRNAHGICIDTRGGKSSLLVTSRATQEVKRFSMAGEFIETIKLPGCSICRPVIKGDNLYFAVIITKSWWDYDGMVAVLDKNNKVVSLPGGSVPEYVDGVLQKPDYDGETFMNPHDVCIDEDENIYVPQWFSGKTYPIKLERV